MYFIKTLLLVILICPSMTNAQSITDFYQLLADYDNDVKIHQISQKDTKWQAFNSQGEVLPLFIDEKNNFLELKDKEKGGVFTMQIALLKKPKGEILIAMVKNHMDLFLHGEIHILKYLNGRFFDVTDEVMPLINYQDFTDNSKALSKAAYNHDLNQHLEFGFLLPKDGEKAYAKMQTDVIRKKCDKNDDSVKDYCQSLTEIAYSSIELIWNPKSGKFLVGTKK